MCAQDEFNDDVVIVESDLLYDAEILRRLAAPRVKQAMAMGHFNHGRSEVKLYLEEGYIKKAQWGQPDDRTAQGEWVGFTRLSTPSAVCLREMLKSTHPEQGKELNYEFFIFELLKQFSFQAIYIQDLPWIEIDNAVDLNRAETEIYPRIDNLVQVAG